MTRWISTELGMIMKRALVISEGTTGLVSRV